MLLLNGNTIDDDPAHYIHNEEFEHLCMAFCTLICIIKNKKLNLAKIFLLILNEPEIKKMYKDIVEIEDDYVAYKAFLDHNQTLYKSKYIKRYIDA
jgi:hypothetical protein